MTALITSTLESTKKPLRQTGTVIAGKYHQSGLGVLAHRSDLTGQGKYLGQLLLAPEAGPCSLGGTEQLFRRGGSRLITLPDHPVENDFDLVAGLDTQPKRVRGFDFKIGHFQAGF